MEKKKRIIDKRIKEKFLMDDAYLNGQAKICGWQATLVYLSLCRHCNKDQESFPSIKLMQEELKIGRNTVIKGLANLEKFNVIQTEKVRGKNGKWLNNSYTLIDKSEWIRSQVPDKDTANQVPLGTSPSPSGDKTKSPTGTLRKHIEGNTYKETHTAEPSSAGLIPQVIKLFEPINSACKRMYGNTTQRKACQFLLDEYGLEKITKLVSEVLPVTNKRPRYEFPYIGTPDALMKNWSRLEDAVVSKKWEKKEKTEKYKVAFTS